MDIRSDLYSLGVTLWEMLVGQEPFWPERRFLFQLPIQFNNVKSTGCTREAGP